MARPRLVVAAVAGLLVATVLFVALNLATPDRELMRGQGEVRWERFQFVVEHQAFTAGSVARFVNEDPVPLEVVLASPSGGNVSLLVPAGGMANATLGERGVYHVRAVTYPWGETSIEVRSANPFVRLYEDIRDFELGSRRGH